MALSPRRKYMEYQKRKQKRTQPKYSSGRFSQTAVNGMIVFIGIMVIMTLFFGFKISNLMKNSHSANPSEPSWNITLMGTEETEPTEPEPTEPPFPVVTNTAMIGVMGDLLMHKPVIEACATLENAKEYDFNEIFQYLDDVVTPLDYSIINLETTFGGDTKPYQGNPMFNCPDSLATAVANAGFDMLTTANNHCFDTGIDGFKRTLQVAADNGLDTTGTYTEDTQDRYFIKEINGIKIGFINYTYETSKRNGQVPQINGINMKGGSYDMINTYVTTAPQNMFDEIRAYKQSMDNEGVEATVVLIHWGTEYSLEANKHQRYIAKTLADIGIDVVIGSHPHVVQPVELIPSEMNPDHKIVCVYSLGNAVSNQRLGNLTTVKTAHTEDGALCTVSFEKYSNGDVYVSALDMTPTWVNMKTGENYRDYVILPLESNASGKWDTMFGLASHEVTLCQESYDRTMAIIGEGLTECQEYLRTSKIDRENAYRTVVAQPMMTEVIDDAA